MKIHGKKLLSVLLALVLLAGLMPGGVISAYADSITSISGLQAAIDKAVSDGSTDEINFNAFTIIKTVNYF